MNSIKYDHGYLIHYGVKGQKWGQRRYVDYDGSLLPEGQQRLKNDARYNTSTSSGIRTPKERLHRIKRSSNKTEALSRTTTPKKINDKTKTKAKKIVSVAAGVALGMALLYGHSKLEDKYYQPGDTSLAKSVARAAKEKTKSLSVKNRLDRAWDKAGIDRAVKNTAKSVHEKKSNVNDTLIKNLDVIRKGNAKAKVSETKINTAFNQLDTMRKKWTKR